METYLYDFDRDMYGKEIVTELLQFKRPEKKFEDIRMLKLQMETDIAEGRKYHEHYYLTEKQLIVIMTMLDL